MLSGGGITKTKTRQLSVTYRQNIGKVNYYFINLSAQALSFVKLRCAALYREAGTHQNYANAVRYS